MACITIELLSFNEEIRMRMLLAVMVFVLSGCSTTQVKDSWKDPAFTGPPLKKVLVIGVSKSDVNRRVFEDGFAKALQGAGVGAAPSYPVLPEAGPIANERVAAAVTQTGSDAVLVTRVLRVKQNVSVSPGYASPGFYGRGFRGYYGSAWMASPPDVDVYDVITIESTLWNMNSDKPVWSGTTEVTEPKNVAAATDELSKVLIARMRTDGVLAARAP